MSDGELGQMLFQPIAQSRPIDGTAICAQSGPVWVFKVSTIDTVGIDQTTSRETVPADPFFAE